MGAFFFVLSASGWHWGQALSADDVVYRRATTACLTAIVLMHIVNVQLCRSQTASLFRLPLVGNRLIMVGIVTEVVLILLIDYTGAGNALFGTAPPGWRAWVIVLPFAIGMLASDEARKAIARWKGVLGRSV